MEELVLDEYCKRILVTLLMTRQEYWFNQLLRFLNDHGVKISRPTLAKHLKHLTQHDILLRQKRKKQKMVYQINFQRFKKLDAASEITQDIVQRFFQQEMQFKSLPISGKIDRYHALTVLQSLLLFKLELLSISKPDTQFENSLATYSTIQHFSAIKKWLLDDLSEKPKLIKQATKELADLVDHYEKVLFTKEPRTRNTRAK